MFRLAASGMRSFARERWVREGAWPRNGLVTDVRGHHMSIKSFVVVFCLLAAVCSAHGVGDPPSPGPSGAPDKDPRCIHDTSETSV